MWNDSCSYFCAPQKSSRICRDVVHMWLQRRFRSYWKPTPPSPAVAGRTVSSRAELSTCLHREGLHPSHSPARSFAIESEHA